MATDPADFKTRSFNANYQAGTGSFSFADFETARGEFRLTNLVLGR